MKPEKSQFYTKGAIPMIPLIQPVLFVDPQTEEPGYICPLCGREFDGETEICPECGEEE